MYLKEELYGLIKTDDSIFDFIQESVLDGLWYWDIENPENEWMNPRFWTVLGYEPDEMPHKSNAWQNIINQDDLKLALENFSKHCKNPNYPYDQVVRYAHKNGATVWIRCRGLAIRDCNGKPIRMLGAHQDVSDIKNREQDLLAAIETAKESEEKYKSMYNNAPLSYQSLDENGCFIDINPNWLETLGYDRNEVIGKWYGDFLHPDYVEHFRINFPEFKKRGFVSDIQFQLRRKDNTYIYVSFEGCIGLTPDGKFKQTYCVFKEITEQKALENALVKAKEKAEVSEEKYRLLYENAGLGIGYFNSEGKIISFNQVAAKFMNGNPEDFIGKSILDLYPKPAADLYLNRIQKAIISTEPVAYEDYVQLPKEEKWFLSTYTKITNTQDKVFGIQIIAQDITLLKTTEIDLKKAKEKTEISEQHFKSLIENAPDGVVIIDESGKFVYVSPNAARLFGYNENEVFGRSGDEYTHPEDLPLIFKAIETIMIDPSQKPSLIYRFKRKDGEYRWIESTFTNLLADKAIKGIILNFSDVTERKQLIDELLIAKEKAEVTQKKLESILENLQDALLQADRNGNFIYVNSRASRMYGYSENELIGLPASNLYADTAERDKLIEKMRIEGKVFDWTGKGLRKDGSSFWVSMNVKFIIDNKGNIAGTEGIVRDITERKKAEETLKAKMEELDRFHKLTVGREITMVELKKEVNNLLNKSGLDNKYKIVE